MEPGLQCAELLSPHFGLTPGLLKVIFNVIIYIILKKASKPGVKGISQSIAHKIKSKNYQHNCQTGGKR